MRSIGYFLVLLATGCTVPPEPTRSTCHWVRCGKETASDGQVTIKNCGPVETGTQDGLSTVVAITTGGAVLSECSPQ